MKTQKYTFILAQFNPKSGISFRSVVVEAFDPQDAYRFGQRILEPWEKGPGIEYNDWVLLGETSNPL